MCTTVQGIDRSAAHADIAERVFCAENQWFLRISLRGPLALKTEAHAYALIFLVRMQRARSLALVTCFTFAILIIINIEYYILISHFL